MAKSLMDLPPELRNEIFFLCESLVPPNFATPTPENKSVLVARHEARNGCLFIDCCCGPCSAKWVQPPITRVNRAIRAETISIYYGANKFFLQTSSGHTWLTKIRLHAHFVTDPVKIGRHLSGSRLVECMLDMGLEVEDLSSGKVLSRKAGPKQVVLSALSDTPSDVLETQ